MTNLTEKLFVWGSLLSGEEAHAQMKGAQLIGTRVRKATGRHGELYAVSPAILKRLDAWERENYKREPVELTDGTTAWCYLKK